jgi:hypothetical protein
MIGVNSRISCNQLFKEIKTLMLASLHILEVTCFINPFQSYVEPRPTV